MGEMTNHSDRNPQSATFTLSIYDRNAQRVETATIIINSLGAGQTKSFEAYVGELPDSFFYKIDSKSAL